MKKNYFTKIKDFFFYNEKESEKLDVPVKKQPVKYEINEEGIEAQYIKVVNPIVLGMKIAIGMFIVFPLFIILFIIVIIIVLLMFGGALSTLI